MFKYEMNKVGGDGSVPANRPLARTDDPKLQPPPEMSSVGDKGSGKSQGQSQSTKQSEEMDGVGEVVTTTPVPDNNDGDVNLRKNSDERKGKNFMNVVSQAQYENQVGVENEPASNEEIAKDTSFEAKPLSEHDSSSEEEGGGEHYSNFNDLVKYNEDGKPYIDAHQLIYSPKLRKKENKGKISWFYADYLFIFCNLMSLVTSAYMFAVGLQSILWDSSIVSVTRTDPANGNSNGTILRFKTSSNPSNEMTAKVLGTILTTMGAVNAVNVMIGFFACTSGYQSLLKQHAIVDISGTLLQLILSIVVVMTGSCNERDMLGFQEGFEFMVRSFVEPRRTGDDGDVQYYATTLLDQVQISMQCCGASNWTDYLSSRVTYLENDFEAGRIFETSKTQKAFPYSCCRSWWVRNIYCADNVHIWMYPNTSRLNLKKFRERIYQVGCAPKIWLSCKRLLFGLGQGFFVWSLFSVIFISLECFSIHLQIRSLNTAIREVQQEEKGVKVMGRGFQQESSDSEDGKDIQKTTSQQDPKTGKDGGGVKAINDLKSKLALPTEDEIKYIKSRTNFAQFELRMKHTKVGKLLRDARKAMVPRGEIESRQNEDEHRRSGQSKGSSHPHVRASVYSEADDDLHKIQRRMELEKDVSMSYAGKRKMQLNMMNKRRASIGGRAEASVMNIRTLQLKEILQTVTENAQTVTDNAQTVKDDIEMTPPTDNVELEMTPPTQTKPQRRGKKKAKQVPQAEEGIVDETIPSDTPATRRNAITPISHNEIPHSHFEAHERDHGQSAKLKGILEHAHFPHSRTVKRRNRDDKEAKDGVSEKSQTSLGLKGVLSDTQRQPRTKDQGLRTSSRAPQEKRPSRKTKKRKTLVGVKLFAGGQPNQLDGEQTGGVAAGGPKKRRVKPPVLPPPNKKKGILVPKSPKLLDKPAHHDAAWRE